MYLHDGFNQTCKYNTEIFHNPSKSIKTAFLFEFCDKMYRIYFFLEVTKLKDVCINWFGGALQIMFCEGKNADLATLAFVFF